VKLKLTNCRLADADRQGLYDVTLENGGVAGVTESGADNGDSLSHAVDCHGFFLLPGLVDLCCEVCVPGYEHREDIITLSRAAAKGGYTSLACLPNTRPAVDDNTVVSYLLNRGGREALIRIYPYGGMTIGGLGERISEIGEMVRAGIIGLHDGGRSVMDASLLAHIFTYASMFSLPVITSCCDEQLAASGVMNQGRMSVALGLRGIPAEAEDVITARNLILARQTNTRLHITNVSTAGSVGLIRQAKKQGEGVTCDTCPHYFTLTEDACDGFNTLAKVRPPLRGQRDVEAVAEGLYDGTIDAISSGHSPQTPEAKQTEFDRAAFGISSLETAFVVSYNALVTTGILSLEELARKMSAAPAVILGLAGKGKVEEGAVADLFLWNPEAEGVIDSSRFASKAKISPYQGLWRKGRVEMTLAEGLEVFLETRN